MKSKAAMDLKPLLERKTFGALIVFLIKHPIIGVRNVLPAITVDRNGERSAGPARDPEEEREQAGGEANETKFDAEELTTILDDAERVIIDQQIVSAAERASDRRLFGGTDRDEDRFVRLILRSSFHDFLVPDATDETQHVIFEPRLFLHETGVVQLTIQMSTEGPLTADQVASLMLGATPLVVRSEMSTPLLDGTSWAHLVTEMDGEMDRGMPVGIIEHAHPVAITDLLLVHLEAVSRASGISLRDWFIYPTAIITAGDCCAKGQWRHSHSDDVKRIVRKTHNRGPLAAHVTEGRDFSYLASNSFFVNVGASTYFQWEGDAPEGIDQLRVVLPIEYGLIVHRRLRTMEEAIGRIALGEGRLRQRYKDALLLFSELRQDSARYGDIREMARHLMQQLGADQIRSNIETALDLSGMAHATISEAKASRRAWWLALAATIVALLVSVPSIQDLLSSVRAEPIYANVEWLIGPLRGAASLGDFWGAWAVVAAILASLSVLWLLGWLYRHRVRRLRLGLRGYAWPREIEVESITRGKELKPTRKDS